MNLKAKIGLGTVQFGLKYGISNKDGQTTANQVTEILNIARYESIDVIDTASAYGSSEEVLGNNNVRDFKIVSKFILSDKEKNITSQLERSLERLQVPSLYGYLSHRPKDIIDNPGLWEDLTNIKSKGLVKKIGFSFNEISEIDIVLKKHLLPDLIQVPFNYFDNRFNKYINQLKQQGCEIHTRSAFLQGLFFIDPGNLSPLFNPVKDKLIELHKYGESLPGLLLKYCLENEDIDRVIIGVNNTNQLISNLLHVNTIESLPRQTFELPDEIIIPSKWKT
jgi:aryl-alcohol dehydrogenase-like predicted oxidoreductase